MVRVSRQYQRGSMTIMMMASLTLVLLFGGGAVDVARYIDASQRFEQAIEAAIVSINKQKNSCVQADVTARNIINDYYLKGVSGVSLKQLDPCADGTTGQLSASLDISSWFAVLPAITVERDIYYKEVPGVIPDPVELSMVLDVSGSMDRYNMSTNPWLERWSERDSETPGGKPLTPIYELRKAMNSFMAAMPVDSGGVLENLRVSIVPFNYGIKDNTGVCRSPVGTIYSTSWPAQWLNTLSRPSQDGPDDIGSSSDNDCITLTRARFLTDSRSDLTTDINSLQANGGTSIPKGMFWGYRHLADSWNAFKPADGRSSPDADKRVVLVSDAGGSPFDQYKFPQLCSHMKNSGITIYSIGIMPSSDFDYMLKGCASDPDKAFNADERNAVKLEDFFDDIAKDILSTEIRLYTKDKT